MNVPTLTVVTHFSSQDIGSNRATACLKLLQELNPNTEVVAINGELTTEIIGNHQVQTFSTAVNAVDANS